MQCYIVATITGPSSNNAQHDDMISVPFEVRPSERSSQRY
jgi:hypothetical protein